MLKEIAGTFFFREFTGWAFAFAILLRSVHCFGNEDTPLRMTGITRRSLLMWGVSPEYRSPIPLTSQITFFRPRMPITSLNMTSTIPAGDGPIIPARFLCFSEL